MLFFLKIKKDPLLKFVVFIECPEMVDFNVNKNASFIINELIFHYYKTFKYIIFILHSFSLWYFSQFVANDVHKKL